MRKSLVTASAIAVTLVLIGCAPRYANAPQMTHAQSEAEYKKGIFSSTMLKFKECNEAIRNPEVNKKVAASAAIVDNDVIYAKDESPNRVALMSSNSKITEVQKKALLEVLATNQECRSGIKQGLASLPILLPVYDSFYGEMDIVYANLISKKITIGQANQEKAKLTAKAKADLASAFASMDNQFRQQHNQEVQARQAEDMQRRAIAAQYLMNQQNIAAQQNMINQQNLQNQINNSKPVMTNCNRFGNQVNCTSY